MKKNWRKVSESCSLLPHSQHPSSHTVHFIIDTTHGHSHLSTPYQHSTLSVFLSTVSKGGLVHVVAVVVAGDFCVSRHALSSLHHCCGLPSIC